MPTPTIQQGITEQPFSALASTAATNSSSFAIPPNPTGRPWTLTWQCLTGGASAANVVVQVAFNDVDAEYTTLDTMSTAGGETRVITSLVGRFLRVRQVSRAIGALTVNFGIS